MSEQYGILLVSHVEELADGLARLLKQVAKDVTVKAVGGVEEGGIGTSFDKLMAALNEMSEPNILGFYDLGSAKMNLELAEELTDKTVHLFDTALIESAYTAAALLQVAASEQEIIEQLTALKIK